MKTKTLLLILSLIAGATTVQAQSQLKTLRGKTKDGKSIVVRYSQGAFEDNIESVKYEVIDELNNELERKRNELKGKENELKAKNREIDKLLEEVKTLRTENDNLKKNSDKKLNDTIVHYYSPKIASLEEKETILTADTIRKANTIAELNKELINRNDSITYKNARIRTLEQTQLTSEEIEEYKSEIEKYKSEIEKSKNRKGKKNQDIPDLVANSGTTTNSISANTQNTSSQVDPNKDADAEYKEGAGAQNPSTAQTQKKQEDNVAKTLTVHQSSQNNPNRNANAEQGDGAGSKPSDKNNQNNDGKNSETNIGERSSASKPEDSPQDVKNNTDLSADSTGQATKAPHVIGFEARMGHALYGHTVNEGWDHDVRFSEHAEVYYGTPRLAKLFSVEAGVGATLFGMSASRPAYELILDGQSDIDNDTYQAQYTYSDLSERLSLVYLDIPVRLCISWPDNKPVSVYGKIGLTPSVLLHSDFSGEGTYTQKGYYEDLQVTLEDIPELGFVTNANCYKADEKPDMSRFTLWGNLEAGAYVRCGKKSPLQLNFGVKVDYPITPIGKAAKVEALPEGAGLLFKGNRVIVPSVAVGLIYQIESKKK